LEKLTSITYCKVIKTKPIFMKDINKKILALALIATFTFASLGSFNLSESTLNQDVPAQKIAYAGTLAGGKLGTATSIIFGGSALVWGAIAFVPGLNVIAGSVALTYSV
jgi:hypothetical protein